jgi:hypothetical protein
LRGKMSLFTFRNLAHFLQETDSDSQTTLTLQ